MADTRQSLGALTKRVAKFEDMAKLGTFQERKTALLAKCDAIWSIAQEGRSYVDKSGQQHSQPDASAMVKVTELAARLLGAMAEAEKSAKEADGQTRAIETELLAKFLRAEGYVVEKAA